MGLFYCIDQVVKVRVDYVMAPMRIANFYYLVDIKFDLE